MDSLAFINALLADPEYRGQMVHRQRIHPRAPSYGQMDRPLHPVVQEALERRGAWPLWSHQVDALKALDRGHNVTIATPTASGKSLCFQIPLMEAILRDRSARALYLAPTKALAQDQLRTLRELLPPGGPRVATFDGDTPQWERPDVRQKARLVISNPDMLHLGILPNRGAWSALLRNLRYVVVDEAHMYRGVFGSHVAAVLRRLRRLCAIYGSSPQFIMASATIGNPGRLAERLTGLPFTEIASDGGAAGGKDFIFWNPPLLDEANGIRRSTGAEANELFTALIRRQVRTIAFVRSRRLAELLLVYARDHLRRQAPELASRVATYRAGYLPEDRRELERRLFDGTLLGVASTNALEVGINIGDLDATLLVGYPGTVASAWQQAGRSGRRGEGSLSVLVAQDNPLDQYFMRHPDSFFSRPAEAALVSTENPHILQPHLLCAAFEAPLSARDANLFGPTFADHVEALERDGQLRRRGQRWFLSPSHGYPAQYVNIRSTSQEVLVIVDQNSGAVLEKLDRSAALSQAHTGAIYLHQGDSFLITQLDLDAGIAYATASDAPYYTQTRDLTDIRILGVRDVKDTGAALAYVGDVEITNTVIAYRKKAHFTEDVLGEVYLDLPPRVFRTVALWFDIPDDALSNIERAKADLAGGLHAAEHTAIGVLPLFAMCDRNDIGGVSTPLHPDTGRPGVFIYDGHPGGVGIAERGYEVISDLWQATLDVLQACPCDDGCPSCVQSPKCGNNNQPLDKAIAAQILRRLLEPQDPIPTE